MSRPAHGNCTVHWCDEVCLVVVKGSFNREGVSAMQTAIRTSWQDAGAPARWAHVMDLRQWEGGTPDSFATARELALWTVTHGAVAVLRIHCGSFLGRVTDRQGVLEDLGVPVIDCSSVGEAWQWLDQHGLACAACRGLIGESS